MGSKNDVKDKIGCDGRNQRSYDSSLPTLGLNNLEHQTNEKKGVDEESNLFERKRVAGYGYQNDHNIPPSERLLRGRLFYFLLSHHRLKKAGQREDKHNEARTEGEKAWPGVVDRAKGYAVSFDTGKNRKEKPEKIAVKENAPHPKSPMMQYIYYPRGYVNG